MLFNQLEFTSFAHKQRNIAAQLLFYVIDSNGIVTCPIWK